MKMEDGEKVVGEDERGAIWMRKWKYKYEEEKSEM